MLRCGSSKRLVNLSRDAQRGASTVLASERNLLACSTSYSPSIVASLPSVRAPRRLKSSVTGPAKLARRLPPSSAVALRDAVLVEEVANQEQQENLVDPSGRSSRGKPSAHVPWNKGRKASEVTKLKISCAQKLRWNRNPELRQQVSEKLKGKVPWNKGRTLSAETRQKMREAKLNRTVGKAVRRKMSKSHAGKTHTQATVAVLSNKLTGKPKSLEHRLSIAASQRRRYAAGRVLHAVEAVHRESVTEGKLGTPQLPPSAASYANCKEQRVGSRAVRSQLLETYKVELREYRALQEELAHWTKAFEQQHGRKPRLRDVELTNIDWLLEKYRKYMVLRERVLSDTQGLRSMLGAARPDPDSLGTGGASGYARGGGASANSAVPLGQATSSAAARMAAVMDYKRARAPDTSACSAGGANSGSSSAADLVPAASGGSADSAEGQMAEALRRMQASADAKSSGAGPIPLVGANAPPRVKGAVLAALEYRKKKAAATAAKANAAAVAAQLKPAGPRPKIGGATITRSVQLQAPLEVLAARQAAEQAVREVADAELGIREALQAMSVERSSGHAAELGEEHMAAA